MTSSIRLSTIAAIYNKRAPTYDNEDGFHPAHQADFLRWMDLQPGQRVLDLACGTGAISCGAAKIVGPSGRVFGIDISGESLSIARLKAEKEGLNDTVMFLEHDVAALHDLDVLEEGTFDVISCASAFVLLDDPENAVREWKKMLKSGGKMIFDVPTSNSMVAGWVINVVAHKLKVPFAFDRIRFDSAEKVKALLKDVGLDDRETFVSGNYKENVLDAKTAGEVFENMIGGQEWFHEAYAQFNDPARKAPAKEMFCQEMEKLADKDGNIRQEMRFNIAVGKKV